MAMSSVENFLDTMSSAMDIKHNIDTSKAPEGLISGNGDFKNLEPILLESPRVS